MGTGRRPPGRPGRKFRDSGGGGRMAEATLGGRPHPGEIKSSVGLTLPWVPVASCVGDILRRALSDFSGSSPQHDRPQGSEWKMGFFHAHFAFPRGEKSLLSLPGTLPFVLGSVCSFWGRFSSSLPHSPRAGLLSPRWWECLWQCRLSLWWAEPGRLYVNPGKAAPRALAVWPPSHSLQVAAYRAHRFFPLQTPGPPRGREALGYTGGPSDTLVSLAFCSRWMLLWAHLAWLHFSSGVSCCPLLWSHFSAPSQYNHEDPPFLCWVSGDHPYCAPAHPIPPPLRFSASFCAGWCHPPSSLLCPHHLFSGLFLSLVVDDCLCLVPLPGLPSHSARMQPPSLGCRASHSQCGWEPQVSRRCKGMRKWLRTEQQSSLVAVLDRSHPGTLPCLSASPLLSPLAHILLPVSTPPDSGALESSLGPPETIGHPYYFITQVNGASFASVSHFLGLCWLS